MRAIVIVCDRRAWYLVCLVAGGSEDGLNRCLLEVDQDLLQIADHEVDCLRLNGLVEVVVVSRR